MDGGNAGGDNRRVANERLVVEVKEKKKEKS